MAFQSFKTIGQVLQTYTLTFTEQDIFSLPEAHIASALLRSEVEFFLREMSFNNSEHAVCESLIFPVLRDVWREQFMQTLVLWSHQTLRYDSILQGVLDYVIARRSPLGKVVFDVPFLTTVEAKKDDFERGWAQCAAGMLAAQKLNGTTIGAVYGIVTNGKMWEFVQLHNAHITKHPRPFSIYELDELVAALYAFMLECHKLAVQITSNLVSPSSPSSIIA
jgi:hypothetical protein